MDASSILSNSKIVEKVREIIGDKSIYAIGRSLPSAEVDQQPTLDYYVFLCKNSDGSEWTVVVAKDDGSDSPIVKTSTGQDPFTLMKDALPEGVTLDQKWYYPGTDELKELSPSIIGNYDQKSAETEIEKSNEVMQDLANKADVSQVPDLLTKESVEVDHDDCRQVLINYHAYDRPRVELAAYSFTVNHLDEILPEARSTYENLKASLTQRFKNSIYLGNVVDALNESYESMIVSIAEKVIDEIAPVYSSEDLEVLRLRESAARSITLGKVKLAKGQIWEAIFDSENSRSANIFVLVESPLVKTRNDKVWKLKLLDPSRMVDVTKFRLAIGTFSPSEAVVYESEIIKGNESVQLVKLMGRIKSYDWDKSILTPTFSLIGMKYGPVIESEVRRVICISTNEFVVLPRRFFQSYRG